jgi:hypothetical protein
MTAAAATINILQGDTCLEKIDKSQARGPAAGGFSVDGGRWLRTYFIQAPQPADLEAMVTQIIGGTTYAPSANGKLQRTPPVADPIYPFLYASAITNIIGVGGQFVIQNSDAELEVQPMPQFALFPWYEITFEFKPRPYAVNTDDEIQEYLAGGATPPSASLDTQLFLGGAAGAPVVAPPTYQPGNYYGINDTGSGPGYPFTYVNEWVRYVDWDTIEQDDYVTAQMGQMQFITNGTSLPNAAGVPFVGSPRIYLPNDILELTWYQVPLRLITSPFSYITRWRGRVNQNSVPWPGGPYTPGSLLFLNYKHKKYTPPVQQQIASPFTPQGLGIFTTDKLCDVTFRFLRTRRYVPDPPLLPLANPNRNFIIGAQDPNTMVFNGGHNALPWLQDRQFHFAITSNINGVGKWPSYLSAPLELLFTDCDATGLTAPGTMNVKPRRRRECCAAFSDALSGAADR